MVGEKIQVLQDWKKIEITVSRLIAQSWLDNEFRGRFLEQPKVILEEAGVVLEAFVEVQFNENADAVPVLRGTTEGNVIYEIPLPPRPEGLSDEQINTSLQDASGNTQIPGWCCFCRGSC